MVWEAPTCGFDLLFLRRQGLQDKQIGRPDTIVALSDEAPASPPAVCPTTNAECPSDADLTSAIVNPNDLRLSMETIKSCDIFKNNELYSDPIWTL